MMLVLAGSADVTTYFHLRLAADGTDATGLTIANVDMQYTRSGVAPTAKVDAVALAATDTAHTDNRGIEIDATDQPGLYRFDWPDAAFTAGVREVLLTIKVATAFTETLRVQIVGFDPAAALATPTNITAGTITTTTNLTNKGDGSGFTAIPWNAAWDAEVQSEVADEIILNNLDHLCKTAVADAQAMAEVVDNTIIGNILSKSSSTTTYDPTTDSLEALRDNTGTAGAGLTAADDAVITVLGVAGAGLSAIPWNAAWDAEVQSEVADEIILNNLDHLCKTAVADAQAMAEVVDNTIISNILSKSSSTTSYDPTTDSLEALRDNTGTAGAGLTAADDAVITLIGVAGAGLTNINLPDQTMNIVGDITGSLSGSVGSVSGNVGGTINGLTAVALKDFFDTDSATTYASAVAGSVVKEIADNAGGASLTVADIADGVWDEAIAGHLGAGSTGEALSNAGAAGTPPTAAEVADAVWDEDATGHQTGGTFGQAIGDPAADTHTIYDAVVTAAAGVNIAADIIAVKAETAAIVADTNELQTDWADGGRLDLILDARASQTSVDDLPTNAELATALGTADDAVLTVVNAIKLKTDPLTFTVANQVDANTESINATTVLGAGSAGDLWRG